MDKQALARIERALKAGRSIVDERLAGSGKTPEHYQIETAACSTLRRTDIGNAERLLLRYRNDLRFVVETKVWAHYDGKRWDMTGGGLAAQKLAQDVARMIYHEASWTPDVNAADDITAHADRTSSANNTKGLLEQAKNMFSCSILDFDAPERADLFNVLNGTLNLRTGKLAKHDPADMLTPLCPIRYRANALATRFVRFIEEVCVDEALNRDQDKEAFLQRSLGYSMFGSNEEQKAFFITGRSNDRKKNGENGKGVLQNTMKAIFCDYFVTVDRRLVCADSRGEIDTKRNAPLIGKRVAFGSELLKTDVFHPQNFKNLTGEDEVGGRLLYSDEVMFENKAALWFPTNYIPYVPDDDEACYRRIVIIPFLNKFYAPADCPPGGFVRDNTLKKKLETEREGILAWLVEGASEYVRRGGIDVPERLKVVRDSTRADFDPLSEWEKRCIEYVPDAVESASDLFESARNFNKANGEAELTATKIGRMLNERTICKIDRDPETGKLFRSTMRKGARLTETGQAYLRGANPLSGQMLFSVAAE
jgi:putative DNA primase/helicase